MFYAQFILAKKGPLAKVWLAAHWESKLSRAQVQETDLSSTAHEIAKPKVKIALRTCGYLLLGLMRIYDKKGYYLYNDCKEAVLRIKSTLDPGKIVWEKEESAIADAMGPDGIMPDFDVTPNVVDISGLNLPNIFGQAPIEQLPIEQITLNDNNYILESPRPEIGIDDFGEVAAGLVEHNEPVNHSVVESARATSVADSRHSLMDQPLIADVLVDEDFGRRKTSGIDQYNFGTDLELDQMFNNPQPLESTRISNGLGNEQIDQTHDSFALEPILENQELVVVKKAPAKRRRRKIIIDEDICISNAEMMAQMVKENYERDTMQTLDIAPPTRSLMKIRQRGTTEKLLTLPSAHDNLHESISRIYSSHISVYKAMPLEKRPYMMEYDEDDAQMLSAIRSVTVSRQSEAIENMRLTMPSFGLEPEADEYPLELPPLDLQEYDIENVDPLNEQPMPLNDKVLDKEHLLRDISNRILDSQPLDSDVLDNISVRDLLSQSPAQFLEQYKANRLSNKDLGAEADAILEPTTPGTYAKKKGAKVSLATDVDEKEELRFTRQTQSVFDAITLRLKASESTTMFSLLSQNSTQKTAAQRFYSLLVLAKYSAIDVDQRFPYENIRISKGGDFDKYIGRVDEFKK